jgi:trans-2,3-dihydro-3-hydroxyanthranilate isomerase
VRVNSVPHRLPYTTLDVFTNVPLEGNPLAVVHDADGVADEVMLRFARETCFSETCFVQTASAPGADYRNRIWTIAREVPFAGHPSLGAAVAVALARGEKDTTYVQQTGAGLQPVDVRLDGSVWHASVLQEPARFGPEVQAAHVLAAVGLLPSDADPAHPPQFVTTGLDTLIAPVRTEQAVARAVPDFDLIDALSELPDFNLYLSCLDRRRERAVARMFTRTIPGGEDPATGSAAGPLCAYLAKREDWTRLDVTQGVEIGRLSRLVAELEGDRVRVGGDVVVVIEGTVAL